MSYILNFSEFLSESDYSNYFIFSELLDGFKRVWNFDSIEKSKEEIHFIYDKGRNRANKKFKEFLLDFSSRVSKETVENDEEDVRERLLVSIDLIASKIPDKDHDISIEVKKIAKYFKKCDASGVILNLMFPGVISNNLQDALGISRFDSSSIQGTSKEDLIESTCLSFFLLGSLEQTILNKRVFRKCVERFLAKLQEDSEFYVNLKLWCNR